MGFESFVRENESDLKNVAAGVRALGMDAVLAAKSGHVGLPLGGAEIGTLLYFGVMSHSATHPLCVGRDRFVLSAGHGSMLQYSLLHFAGYNVTLDDIKAFRQVGSRTPGHPEYGHTEGIEVTTGPLGQGIANAVGMAISERMCAARFNDGVTLFDSKTYVVLGDGCMMEGVSSEACSLAGHLKLSRLVAIYDANNITIDGTIDIAFTEDVGKRFEAYGWNVLHAEGNSFESLACALDAADQNAKKPQGEAGPTLIIAKGIAGKGSPKWEGKPKIHGNPMSAEDVGEAKKHIGLKKTGAFEVDERCYQSAKKLIARPQNHIVEWEARCEKQLVAWKKSDIPRYNLWKALVEKHNATEFDKNAWNLAKGKTSTRVASGKALVELAKLDPSLVGGSADLAGSNNTTLPDTTFIGPRDFSGRNIHFGVREHGMAAIVNGMALHGVFRPYCATFAVFSDYMRPSIRLAALMKTKSIFILTHDSYAVGEDGPTHQPVEHAAALRAIPDLRVYRPADALETFVAWQTTLSKNTPVALLLTRQDVDDLDSKLAPQKARQIETVMDGFKEGGYLLKDFENNAPLKIVLVASGSEVSLALDAAKILESTTYETFSRERLSLSVRVVSCPAPQLLRDNPVTLNSLVPPELPIVAVEAGVSQSWGEIVGRSGAIYGLDRFGMSGPANKVADELGYVPAKLALFVSRYLKLRDPS